MTAGEPAPPFPVSLAFPDVDADILAREDAAEAPAWPGFLRRTLTPRPPRSGGRYRFFVSRVAAPHQ